MLAWCAGAAVQGKQAEEYIKAGTMVPASMIIGEHAQDVLLQHQCSITDRSILKVGCWPQGRLSQLGQFAASSKPHACGAGCAHTVRPLCL